MESEFSLAKIRSQLNLNFQPLKLRASLYKSLNTTVLIVYRLSFLLKGHSYSHSHGGMGTRHETATNINIRAAFLHTLGDVIHSIAVLIAALIIKLKVRVGL